MYFIVLLRALRYSETFLMGADHLAERQYMASLHLIYAEVGIVYMIKNLLQGKGSSSLVSKHVVEHHVCLGAKSNK